MAYSFEPQPQPPRNSGSSKGLVVTLAVLIVVLLLVIAGTVFFLWRSATGYSAQPSPTMEPMVLSTKEPSSSSSAAAPAEEAAVEHFPPGMDEHGFVGAGYSTCVRGGSWIYAMREGTQHALICENNGDTYFVDDFGEAVWDTDVTAINGPDDFEMTTLQTTIYIQGTRLFVVSEGVLKRDMTLNDVYSRY